MTLPLANFSHQFLLAMPTMVDPRFAESVIYMLHHDEDGAVGLVINQETNISVAELLEEIQVPVEGSPLGLDAKILRGGPVSPEVGFVLHRAGQDWQSSRIIQDDLCLTSSRDILHAIASAQGPAHFLVILGYAGWGPGQLEREMVANAWLNCPYDAHIVFHQPIEQRWQAAAQIMGIDMRLLSVGVGHA